MCLISAFPKGVKKDTDFLYECISQGFLCNGDGSGYAIKYGKSGQLYISKGYWVPSVMKDSIRSKKLSEDDELIIHHRIGTSGKKNDLNTHPFVVSDIEKEIVKTEGFVTKAILAHNGVFSKYTKHTSNFSDTFHFTKEFMAVPEIWALLNRDKEVFKTVFDSIISYNKVAILHPDKDLELLGTFTEDQGAYFSNTGYKSYVRNVGGKEARHNSAYYRGQDEYDDYSYGAEYTTALEQQWGSRNCVLPQQKKLIPITTTLKPAVQSVISFDRTVHLTPKEILSGQIEIKLDIENHKELVLVSINPISKDLEEGKYYKIHDKFKPSDKSNYVYEVGKPGLLIWMETEDIQNDCAFIADTGYEAKYTTYMNLKKNYPISKNFLKKLGRKLALSHGKSVIKMKYWGELDFDGASLFYKEKIAIPTSSKLRQLVETELGYNNFD